MAQPVQQDSQMWTISIHYCHELKTHAMTWFYMPHYGVGPELSFLHKEIERGRRTHSHWTCRLDKQPPKAQIPNLGNLITSVTAPNDPDALRCDEISQVRDLS